MFKYGGKKSNKEFTASLLSKLKERIFQAKKQVKALEPSLLLSNKKMQPNENNIFIVICFLVLSTELHE